jgi:hypothetical protein
MSLLDTLLHLPDSKRVSETSPPSSPIRPALDAADPTSEALAALKRLKTFTLPAGRMGAAREIAQRLASTLGRFNERGEPVEDSDDPTAILEVLRAIERDLVALGGTPDDPELAAIVARVEGIFPDAQLVEVKGRRT